MSQLSDFQLKMLKTKPHTMNASCDFCFVCLSGPQYQFNTVIVIYQIKTTISNKHIYSDSGQHLQKKNRSCLTNSISVTIFPRVTQNFWMYHVKNKTTNNNKATSVNDYIYECYLKQYSYYDNLQGVNQRSNNILQSCYDSQQ